MRSNWFSKEVMSILKQHARARGLTQASLAKALRVSLPTLKRWLSGKAITLENMKRVSDLLGMSFIEIASAIEETHKPYFQYTVEQEDYFSKNPYLLAFFDHLIRGHTPTKVQKKFNLSTLHVERYLSRLEKLGLIDWLPKNKAVLKSAGEPQWRRDGPLSRKFRPQIQDSFMEGPKKIYEKFVLHDYLPEDRLKIEKNLEEVIELSKQANARATVNNDHAQPGGLFVSFKEFRWNLDDFLRNP